MLNEWLIGSGFLMGLMGSVHCIGMCGGIVGALTLPMAAATRTIEIKAHTGRSLPLFYNLGRISSYTLAGALAGAVSFAWFDVTQLDRVATAGRVIGGGFMLALGLYLGGWWHGLGMLERVGTKAWRHIEPLGRRVLPPRRPLHAYALGLVWGWLPCGMVYAALGAALASGSSINGAAVMAAFGLGTLPMLLGMSFGARAGWLHIQQTRVRTIVGVVLVLGGLYLMLSPVIAPSTSGVAHHH